MSTTVPEPFSTTPDANASGARRRIPWWPILILPLISAILVLAVETLHRGSFAAAWKWMVQGPRHFLANFGLLYLLITALRVALNRRCMAAALIGIPLLAVARISAAKMGALGEPLVPWDYRYVPQMLLMVRDTGGLIHLLWALPVIGVLALAWWLDRRLPARLSRRRRIVLLALVLPLPMLSLLHAQLGITRQVNILAKAGTANPARFQAGRYNRVGFPIAYWSLIANAPRLPTGEMTSRPVVEEVLSRIRQLPARPAGAAPGRPHIVILMVESFWDITQLTSVTFTPDPLANLHAGIAGASLRTCISPVLGGFTCNPEFELLTGWNMTHIPHGLTPYLYCFNAPSPGLPRFLKQQGYRTIGIHPYHRRFWCRDSVYPNLGFDRFDALESFGPSDVLGTYVSDMALVDRMIGELDAAADEPTFLFGVTMQNHSPFPPNTYPQRHVQMSHSLSPAAAGVLDTYVQGAYHTDQAIGKLLRYVQQSPRPIVLVIFGDHFPALGADIVSSHSLAVARELGLLKGESPTLDEAMTLHSTPLLLAANFDSGYKPTLPAVSPSFIIPDILQLAGMDHPFYVRFLDDVRQSVPALTQQIKLDRDGTPGSELPPAARDLVRDYGIIQADILFGDRHSESELFEGK